MSVSQVSAAKTAVGRIEIERIPFGSPAQEVARIVQRDGGVILTGALTREVVDAINQDIDAQFGALPQGNFGDGDRNFLADFFGRKTKRLTHCLKYSKTLRETFLNRDEIPEYLAATMPGPIGAHTMYSSHAIEIHPGETAQDLHRDGSGLMETLCIEGPAGANIQVNFLLALTEVTEEMGATRVIPGSNHWEDFKAPGSQEETIPATMNPGDVLMISGKVLHGGGANLTKDRPRRVLSTAFSPGIILGEEAWPYAIPLDEARTYPPRIQAYLGFRSISYKGEQPGFLWRVDTRPLEEYLGL